MEMMITHFLHIERHWARRFIDLINRKMSYLGNGDGCGIRRYNSTKFERLL